MNKLATSVLLTAFLFGLFVFGTLTQQILPMMSAFCLWTPVAWFTGYCFARAGVRIVVSSGEKNTPIPELQSAPRQRTNNAKRRIMNNLSE